MKFNIVVDLEDFWMDEDSQAFNEQIKQHISKNVKNEIWKSIKNSVEDQISRDVKKAIETQYIKKIQTVIAEVIESEKIKDGYNNKEVSIQDYIKNQFQSNSGWNSPNSQIEKLAKAFADDLKKRYDLLFATQIVSKIGANGMLKDDVAKLLLDANV